jgi:hypothetical protein
MYKAKTADGQEHILPDDAPVRLTFADGDTIETVAADIFLFEGRTVTRVEIPEGI